jgi:hypothetical protein
MPLVDRLHDIFEHCLLAANQSNQCIDPKFPSRWTGYRIAKRRLDVYTTNHTVCLHSPFVWVKDNTTNGLLPEQSWESEMWCSGQPDCAINYARYGTETCCHFAMFISNKINDCSCWYPHCPLCQMDANWVSCSLSHAWRATRFFQNTCDGGKDLNGIHSKLTWCIICNDHHVTNNFCHREKIAVVL